MKKMIYALAILSLCSLTACGSKEPQTQKTENQPTPTQTVGSQTAEIQTVETQNTAAQTSEEQETETSQPSFPVDSAAPADADSADTMELTEEEKLLNERMAYYRESAYYDEIMYYWEKARGVTDISYLIETLYASDKRYLTKENLFYDPPVVIHLAKNEIYARHGYIFRDEDLYNYFMGCLWYTPTTPPEDFDDTVFNEYEIENLKLLAELDTL